MTTKKLSSSKTRCRLFILLSPALFWPLSACSHDAGSEGLQAVQVVPAAKVVHVDLHNTITLTAEFEPFYEVDVMAKEAGYIHHMLVDIGDRVQQGQLLATLEIPELQADLVKARSDVETASAERAVTRGDLQRAQAGAQIALLSYNRIQDVSKKEPGLVPLQEVDVAHSHNLEADAQVSAALQRVQAAESRYQSAVAGLAHETALVEYTRIVAPFRGVDERRGVDRDYVARTGRRHRLSRRRDLRRAAQQDADPSELLGSQRAVYRCRGQHRRLDLDPHRQANGRRPQRIGCVRR